MKKNELIHKCSAGSIERIRDKEIREIEKHFAEASFKSRGLCDAPIIKDDLLYHLKSAKLVEIPTVEEVVVITNSKLNALIHLVESEDIEAKGLAKGILDIILNGNEDVRNDFPLYGVLEIIDNLFTDD